MSEDFYCRYYVGTRLAFATGNIVLHFSSFLITTGHKGQFGHEFMEFELTQDGKLRYANNSNYKKDTMIRKEGLFL